jgi:predicted O-linked N-acetylglucosamine transferase (SPINDLY family)
MPTLTDMLEMARHCHRTGDFRQAEQIYRQLLWLRPDSADMHFNLGLALKQQGRLAEAAASYREALRLRSDDAEAHNNLGTTLALLGQPDAARAHLERALHCDPSYAAAHNNLGKLLDDQGQAAAALLHFRRAVALRPDYAEAHYNLAATLDRRGWRGEAAASYREAVRLRPDFAAAHNNLGNLLRQQRQLDDALMHLREALRLRPDFAEAQANLGHALADQGKVEEARTAFAAALRLRPDDRQRVAAATLLPPVYASLSDLESRRARLAEEVGRLRAEGVTLDLTNEPAVPVFYLAYQGRDDRDLQRDLASLCRVPAGEATFSRPPGGKIKVGFLSAHFRDHTIGRLTQGPVAMLARDAFSVTVLSLGRHDDALARFFKEHADRHVELPRHLPTARRLIAAERLDVLYYTDVGMEPFSHALAFSRLAPVQCVTWGHPVTSGIPTLDYFLSSDLLEADGADEHYTERLVRLKTLPIYYYRPRLPEPLPGRDRFGLPDDRTLYACPQSLFKLHPDFDGLLGGILRGDPRGLVVLLHGRHPHWDELLRQRFAATIPDVVDRVRFLPPLAHADFLALGAIADVLLDPPHFGGGNTSYEALAAGTPIVTLPSPYLRGRITLALYRQMGVLECVASGPEDYVAKAVRLGTDADYRAAVRARLRAASEVLYENPAGVRELEGFLRKVVGSQ